MSPSLFSSSLFLLSFLFLLAPTISAHNITKILDRDPDFSTFNELLTKTHLADQINSRKTITILAIPNDNIGDLASKPIDVAKEILMSHVVLDYYDILKLQKMKGKSTILTTMFQTTGVASYQQGFLNVTDDKSTGQIVFGSAVKGAQHNVNYLGTVASLPYNISVLSVSAPIVAPGISGQPLRPIASPPKSNAPSPKVATPPVEAPEAETPANAPEADSPSTDSPAPSEDSEAPTDAPASSPSAEAPTADDASDNANSPTSSAGKLLASSSFAFLVVLASFLFAHIKV